MRSVRIREVAAAVFVATLAMGGAGVYAADCNPSTPDAGQSPSFADLIGVTVTQCAGFYGGNAINAGNAGSLSLINSVLFGWGLGPVASWVEKYNTDNPAINFNTMLYGDTVVAFHWGNFPGGPAGNVSAVYRFDAGVGGVDIFNINGGQGLSNAAVYVTQALAVPEPQTYALMLAGLGVVGFVARRRRPNV